MLKYNKIKKLYKISKIKLLSYLFSLTYIFLMFPNLSVEQLYPGISFYSGLISDSPSEAEGEANAPNTLAAHCCKK